MIFDHVLFIFIFLPLLLVIYRLVPASFKNVVLLIASLLFYAWGCQGYILLLLASMALNYVGSMFIEDWLKNEKETLRYLVILLIVANLALLFGFKYYQGVTCPMGLTFYTLMQIGYLLQVANGEIRMAENVLDYAVCVTFFPLMLAGPVLEFSTMQEQLHLRKHLNLAVLGDGLMWFIRGLAKATVLARCAGIMYQGLAESKSMLGAWLMCAAFGFELYFALSGYSDMATGLGKLLGFKLPKNFRYPIMSKTFTEFIRRWYTSLTDYLNHFVCDMSVKKHGIELIGGQLLVAVFMGIFYSNGAGTIIWGAFLGILIILEKMIYGKALRKLPLVSNLYFLILSLIGWGLFTGNSVAESLGHLSQMLGVGANGLVDSTFTYYFLTNFFLWIVLLIASLPFVHNIWVNVFDGSNQILNVINAVVYIVMFMICLAFIVTETTALAIPVGVFTS
ncbi:MAG: hypothetical protein MJ097_04255 [Dorea sp.]|nr:hypothetical protein [Dorea sp.]